MKRIGITGPSGAGKSLLSDHLSSQGFPIIDADAVYHSLLIPPSDCLNALRHAFGDAVFSPNGTLNRAALSEIVFHDEAKLSLLNQTVLGFVLERIRVQLNLWEKQGYSSAIVDAPTLIESGFHKECDAVISVLSAPELRIRRIMKRDGISEERAAVRVRAQQSDDFYRTHSDYVLENRADRAAFLRQADALFSELCPIRKESP